MQRNKISFKGQKIFIGIDVQRLYDRYLVPVTHETRVSAAENRIFTNGLKIETNCHFSLHTFSAYSYIFFMEKSITI